MFMYYFFRLMCIFVSLTDFVKCSVPNLVNETMRYRNYHYYYYIIHMISQQYDFGGSCGYLLLCLQLQC